MRAVKSRDTSPELAVRALLRGFAPGYRLHRRDIPGNPDIAYVGRNQAIFVHGCFWHMHKCRYGRVKPATNANFWKTKREGNVERDKRNLRKLRRQGWKVLIVWECQTRNPQKLSEKVARFLCEGNSGE